SVPPTNPITVHLSQSGSTNIMVTGDGNLLFDSSNWNMPQIVVVSAPGDSDTDDSRATLILSGDSAPAERVEVLALDNDIDDEFSGPFGSWVNLKTDFGARGDDVTDDTAAFQAGLDALRSYTNKPVLYIPAGNYRISQTLNLVRSADSEFKDI